MNAAQRKALEQLLQQARAEVQQARKLFDAGYWINEEHPERLTNGKGGELHVTPAVWYFFAGISFGLWLAEDSTLGSWLSVREHLPSDMQTVQIAVPDPAGYPDTGGYVDTGCYSHETGKWHETVMVPGSGGDTSVDEWSPNVSHWRPLPRLPRMHPYV